MTMTLYRPAFGAGTSKDMPYLTTVAGIGAFNSPEGKGNIVGGFSHRYRVNPIHQVLKERRNIVLSGLGSGVLFLPVVKTTGYITKSLSGFLLQEIFNYFWIVFY
jgi:hypothetical protein